jgi:predicted dehydrogenase
MEKSHFTNRRNFLKSISIGAGVLASGLYGYGATGEKKNRMTGVTPEQTQLFNMCGYGAPKINSVRIGVIGLGNRGREAVTRLVQIENVEIIAISDKYENPVRNSQKDLNELGMPKALEFTGNEYEWKKLCERPDIDLVYICTPWAWHTPMAVYAMEQGKHVCLEVPAAKTIDEAWQLVETSERTRKHCIMLENCCYDFFELLTLNMARQGYFGELVHGEAAYIHNLMRLNFDKNYYADMWRLKENRRKGNLYPTHGLGPVCQAMNINRGDKMEFLTSVSSNDFLMGQKARELAAKDSFYEEFATQSYRGNMSTTTIKTNLGRTIMVQHDVSSTRPYSRIHLISGTKGIVCKWPEPARISLSDEWLDDAEMQKLEEKYSPEIVKYMGEIAKKVGGHGGMDFMMDWRNIDCLRNGLPPDQDVYDAALWSCIAPLSEWSVANRSNSTDIPDFTRGAWKENKPVELTLKGGGTTGVREAIIKAELQREEQMQISR